MSAPANCPGCGAKLQPDWEHCPNCPLSFRDETPEKGALQNDTFRSIGLPFLFYGVLAYSIWSLGQFLWRTAEDGTKAVASGARKTPVSQTPMSPPYAGRYDPSRAMPVYNPPAADENEGVVSITPLPAKKRRVVNEWKMRGRVYDLITLQAVPGVQMIFTDYATNSRARIVTDEEGRYRVILPPLPGRGYYVTLAHSDYVKSYLDPATEGVADISLERRRELVHELTVAITMPALLRPRSESPLVTDFHIAPR